MGNLLCDCVIISNKNKIFNISVVPKNEDETIQLLINHQSSLFNSYIKEYTKDSLSKEIQGILDPFELLMECIEKKNVELIETNDNSSIKLILIHKLNNKKYQLKIPRKEDVLGDIILNLEQLQKEHLSSERLLASLTTSNENLTNEINNVKNQILILEEKISKKDDNCSFFNICGIKIKNESINDYHLHDFQLNYFTSKECNLCFRYFNNIYSCNYCNIHFCQTCEKNFENCKKINKKIHSGHQMTLLNNVLKEECIGCKNTYYPRFYCTFCKFGLCIKCFFGVK